MRSWLVAPLRRSKNSVLQRIMTTNDLASLTDEALIAETHRVAEMERRAMADLLSLLIEVERRRLCEKLGYPSLFAYCTQVLGLSEHAAYSRITAARAVRRVPAMLPMLADGALTLSIRARGQSRRLWRPFMPSPTLDPRCEWRRRNDLDRGR